MVVALVLALFLDADSLHAKAHAQPDGWRRDVAVAVMGPVRSIARVTGLNRPRGWLEDALGREQQGRSQGRRLTAAPSTAPATVAPPIGTPPPPPPVILSRVPTREAPLRLWVGGDSQAEVFGESVVARAVARGDIRATLDWHSSTGLTRPDFFDWPAHLVQKVLPTNPEVIVLMFGANDAQGMNVGGKAVSITSPVWQEEYRRRVAETMDAIVAPGRLVYWVGQPVMRDGGFSDKEAILDGIYRDEASRRPGVRFIDTRPLLSTPTGAYSAYLPGPDGRPVLMRAGDGVHLSRSGGNRVADELLKDLDAEIAKARQSLPPPTVTPPTTVALPPSPQAQTGVPANKPSAAAEATPEGGRQEPGPAPRMPLLSRGPMQETFSASAVGRWVEGRGGVTPEPLPRRSGRR
jgi:hypothetical protein